MKVREIARAVSTGLVWALLVVSITWLFDSWLTDHVSWGPWRKLLPYGVLLWVSIVVFKLHSHLSKRSREPINAGKVQVGQRPQGDHRRKPSKGLVVRDPGKGVSYARQA